MQNLTLKLVLILSYFVFAILLNSVGTVVLQVQNSFGVSPSDASVLEGFKDISIAITSFLIASFIVKIGYKRAMLAALAFVTAGCLMAPELPTFWMTKILFAIIGISFALIKISVFATLGLITSDQKGHASLMNFLEAFFMIGVLSGYFIFSAFVDDTNSSSLEWMNVYYWLAAMTAIAFIFIYFVKIDETPLKKSTETSLAEDISGLIKLGVKPLALVFIVSVFLYVLIEQSIMTWLPTFNAQVLNLPTSLSIQMASILAGATALGRMTAGFVLRYIDWYKFLALSIIAASGLILLTLPLTAPQDGQPVAQAITSWADAPLIAWLFPMIGLLIAPIYPVINSVVLSALPAPQHAPMSGLIVVFSALGGTTGSLITGNLFDLVGGQAAFYFSLVPFSLILITLFIFKRSIVKGSTQ